MATIAQPAPRLIPRAWTLAAMTTGLSIALLSLAMARSPDAPATHLISMAESGRTMARAGDAMERHGRTMIADASVADQGWRWVVDGRAVAQGGAWMAMDPTAGSSLVTSPATIASQGNRGALERATRAMLHDPRGATDLEALRWNGLSMRDEGRNMVDHGQRMAEDLGRMRSQHRLDADAENELAEAAAQMRTVGAHLEANGQAMIDEADRLSRAFALR